MSATMMSLKILSSVSQPNDSLLVSPDHGQELITIRERSVWPCNAFGTESSKSLERFFMVDEKVCAYAGYSPIAGVLQDGSRQLSGAHILYWARLHDRVCMFPSHAVVDLLRTTSKGAECSEDGGRMGAENTEAEIILALAKTEK